MPAREFVEAAEANLLAAIAIWAAASEGGAVERRDGALFARSAVLLRSFNNVLITDHVADTTQLLMDASRYFEPSGGRYRMRLREDVMPFGDEEFLAHRFERCGGIPCLTISLPLAARSEASFEIRAVDDDAMLADHTSVVAAGFDWEPDVLARVFRRGLLDTDAWRGFVGYVNGEAAGAAQLVVSDGVAGIYYVATTERMRRRGIGEAMTRRALDVGAARGCSLGSLQASPMGRPIYERMGFEVVSGYRTYVPAESQPPTPSSAA